MDRSQIARPGSSAVSQAGLSPSITILVAYPLIVFCVTLALLIGNIGFWGDDWWQFSWPYWFPFPQSIWEYAKESRRPIEGIYTVLAFESFGLNRVLYTITALLLSAGSCLLLASCLKNAFPGRPSLAVLSSFFAFVLIPASNLIYMFHTDNSRLSMLFFWSAVFAFQKWSRSSCSAIGLIVPVLLYLLGAFTYENTTFLIFCVPFFAWPVYLQSENELSKEMFLFRLSAGIIGGFAIFVLVRFAVFSGGAVHQSSLIPPFHLIWSYLTNLIIYTVYPVYEIPKDVASWLWGAPIALVLAALMFYSSRGESSTQRRRVGGYYTGSTYIACLGLSFLLLGMLPYLMAGYESGIGFTSQSRVYSSASYGLAILLGLFATAPRNPRVRSITKVFAVLAICLMAVFLAGLRKDWQEAARQRSKITEGLINQAPHVEANTTFLFLDLQSYITREGIARAVVFQGVDGLGEWARMLYRKKDIYAYFLYSKAQAIGDTEGRIASVSPQGMAARGSVVRGLIPLNTILIMKREPNEMRLLDSLSEMEGTTAINWQGISEIKSNKNLIMRP